MFEMSNSLLLTPDPTQTYNLIDEKLSNMAKVIVVLVETALIETALAASLNEKGNGSEPSI